MAKATTAKYEQMILEVEWTDGSDTYTNVCGLVDVTINRTSNIDTSEIPDCTDESKPLSIERQVRSQEVTVSASGVWALSSHQNMLAWWRAGTTLNVRLRNAKVESDGATDDIYAESGPAILVSLNNGRTKGQKVSAEVEIQFDGVPATALVV
ncbi:phage tail tube protein [Salipiger abyssi]|nr:phage tail tube protein [Salipiger abyssi]